MVPKVVIVKHYSTMEMWFLPRNLIGNDMVLRLDLLYSCKAPLTFFNLPLQAWLIILLSDATPPELEHTSKPVLTTMNVARLDCAFLQPSLFDN